MFSVLFFALFWSFLVVQAHVFLPQNFSFPEPPVIRLTDNACKLPSPARMYLSEGFGARDFVPSVGKLKANMIFVDFEDAPANETIQSLYDALIPEATKWYKTASYGKLDLVVDADARQFYRMPKVSTAYGWSRGEGLKLDAYIRDATFAVGAKSKFTKSDLFYIVPTRQAKAIWMSPTNLVETRLNGVKMGMTVTFGQDMWKWGYKILNHETGHTMGLPDLYPEDTTGMKTTEWVGGYDIMGLISGTSPDYLAWHRWKLGWLDDDQISCVTQAGSSKHAIAPVEVPGGTKAAAVRISNTHAFVVEVRSNLGNNNASCSVGVIGYIVNTTANRFTSAPVQIINAHPSARGCSARSGQLSASAVNFAKGDKTLKDELHKITVTVDDVEEGIYHVTIDWDGTGSFLRTAQKGYKKPKPGRTKKMFKTGKKLP